MTFDLESHDWSTTLTSLAARRRAAIAELVRTTGYARVSDLARRFEVSTVTIRQDVAALAAEGRLQRTFGGATARPESSLDTPFEQRARQHAAVKRRIGIAAASLIRPGETVLLDAGTTALEVARHLPADLDLTVITCALDVALEAAERPGVEVVVCGGRLNARTHATMPGATTPELAQLCADRLFLGTYGVDVARGLGERSFEVAETKRALIDAAREVVLLCDSSKFGQRAPVLAAPLHAVARVLTDDALPAASLAALRAAGIEVDLVPAG